MKTFNTTIALFTFSIFAFTVQAQTVVYNGSIESHQNNNAKWGGYGSGYGNQGNVNGGSVSVTFGSYPSYGNGYYNNNYNSYNNYNGYGNNYNSGYSVKRAARYSINRGGAMINDAMNFQAWNDTYSPLLAKAIRHQEYARQLYWWGNYQDAYNHAERASYLAWYVMSYYNNGYYGNGYNNGNGNYQPNPYSDPYNPYYKQSNPNGNPGNDPAYQNGGYNGMKQAPAGNNPGNATQAQPSKAAAFESNAIDNSLPASKANDKELLRSVNAKDLMVE